MRLLLALLAASLLALPACIAEGSARASRAATQGVIVTGALDEVWFETRQVVAGMGGSGTDVDGLRRSLTTTVRGAKVRVRVEPFDPSRTIVHVTGTNPAVVQDVQLAIQRRLLR